MEKGNNVTSFNLFGSTSHSYCYLNIRALLGLMNLKDILKDICGRPQFEIKTTKFICLFTAIQLTGN